MSLRTRNYAISLPIYQESNGVDTGEFLKLWYDYSYLYSEKALNLYSAE